MTEFRDATAFPVLNRVRDGQGGAQLGIKRACSLQGHKSQATQRTTIAPLKRIEYRG